jgi:predicted RNA binding protein YcfA (HicA-like mRNA interferase family)
VKSRELIRALERAGGDIVRRRGDHVTLKFPDGRVISVPHGGRQNEVSAGRLREARKFLPEDR